MSASDSDTSSYDLDPEITLGVLSAVESNYAVTQRSVAKEVGIALGLANAYLKRCAKKGLIKVTDAPANRYAYYLTPKGFAEKSLLTARYLTVSFNFFREARGQCRELYAQCEANGWTRVALSGANDLTEIATLCAHDYEVELLGVIDAGAHCETFAGLPVASDPTAWPDLDAVIVTNLEHAQQTFERLTEIFPDERVLAPRFLHISRGQPTLME